MVYFLESVLGDCDGAIVLCKVELASQLDTIHGRYWNYKAAELEKKREARRN